MPISANSTITVLQTGNIYLLLAGLVILCCFFSSPQVARNYLLVVACGDLGHIYATYAGLGGNMFFDVANWNDMVWGHVGTSIFLFVNRVATAAGIFGSSEKGDSKRE
ncbi:hypothetical protein GJ744_010000 [Endocarpon pusillum]|uniref:DUF7704 domain-containing protein n=1 Tax=Endocarpon pusillum TaxID=364733 RepID=A0A8H7E5S6_9EURO|nr:hypothetical protein GJ744_010000 [Endocarpon pusillum]